MAMICLGQGGLRSLSALVGYISDTYAPALSLKCMEFLTDAIIFVCILGRESIVLLM